MIRKPSHALCMWLLCVTCHVLKNLLHEVPKTVKPPPICLCSKREDAGGVDHLLLLEQVHAVWAKKPETSGCVPIKRCEFYQPSHNTASYLQFSSCQSWAQTTCRWGWWGFTVTVSAHISGQEPAYSLFVTSALFICFSVSQSYHQWSTQNDKIFGETIFSHSFCDPAKNFSFLSYLIAYCIFW